MLSFHYLYFLKMILKPSLPRQGKSSTKVDDPESDVEEEDDNPKPRKKACARQPGKPAKEETSEQDVEMCDDGPPTKRKQRQVKAPTNSQGAVSIDISPGKDLQPIPPFSCHLGDNCANKELLLKLLRDCRQHTCEFCKINFKSNVELEEHDVGFHRSRLCAFYGPVSLVADHRKHCSFQEGTGLTNHESDPEISFHPFTQNSAQSLSDSQSESASLFDGSVISSREAHDRGLQLPVRLLSRHATLPNPHSNSSCAFSIPITSVENTEHSTRVTTPKVNSSSFSRSPSAILPSYQDESNLTPPEAPSNTEFNITYLFDIDKNNYSPEVNQSSGLDSVNKKNIYGFCLKDSLFKSAAANKVLINKVARNKFILKPDRQCVAAALIDSLIVALGT
ncbi:hypothetical protein Fcan01_11172 [Folsomia candida]|uniref:C2H2-type domain-containing protein n=1 Tax=Folsomia candida TaxID=158441 RepID=A0A226E801_FOLCA|nr:hypothetical protein Fcan01_11172 [Folsomia candida]